jgi:hypothetical protein
VVPAQKRTSAAYQFFNRVCPTTPYLQERSPKETMNKIALHCAVWVLAFCAVLLISPAILIYCVPFGIEIVSDIAQLDYGPTAVLLFISTVGLLLAHRAAAAEAKFRWSD